MRKGSWSFAAAVPVFAAVATATVLIVSGCAPTAQVATVGETISSSKTCADIGNALTIEFNAAEGLRLKSIDHDEYVRGLEDAKTLMNAVAAKPGSAIEEALSALVSYIDQAAPTGDGAPYDTSSPEYTELKAHLGAACTSSGSDVVIVSKYGG